MPTANAAAIDQSMLPSSQCVASVGTVNAAATTSEVPAARAAVKPNATMNNGTSTMPPPVASRPATNPAAATLATTSGVRSTRGCGAPSTRSRDRHDHPDAHDDEQEPRRQEQQLVAHDPGEQRADDHRRHRRRSPRAERPVGRAPRRGRYCRAPMSADGRTAGSGDARAIGAGIPRRARIGVPNAEPPAPKSPKARPIPTPASTTGIRDMRPSSAVSTQKSKT